MNLFPYLTSQKKATQKKGVGRLRVFQLTSYVEVILATDNNWGKVDPFPRGAQVYAVTALG